VVGVSAQSLDDQRESPGAIEKVFYPVFPPDRNAGDVVA
jgi:hypothetical protein